MNQTLVDEGYPKHKIISKIRKEIQPYYKKLSQHTSTKSADNFVRSIVNEKYWTEKTWGELFELHIY